MIKKLNYFIVLIITIFFANNVSAQDKIAFIDLNYVYANSKIGKKIIKEVQSILDSYGTGSGHVFNLGHGITPDINPDNVEVLVNAVHDLSKKYHKN